MIQLNHTYKNEEKLLKAFESHNIDTQSEAILVQVFTSAKKKALQKALDTLKRNLPNAIIIGASSAGEINAAKMSEKKTVFSISEFKKTKLHAHLALNEDSTQLAYEITKKLLHSKSKCLITFADGLHCRGEEYIKALSHSNSKNIPIAGGMSADLFTFNNTFLIYDTQIIEGSAAVGVSLQSDILEVYTDYNLGWRKVGPEFTITKSDGPRVYEINNRAIKDIYAEVLGNDIVANMPISSIEFPLVKEEDGVLIARSMIQVLEDGSILFAGNLNEHDKVYFGLGSLSLVNHYDPNSTIQHNINKIQASFLYSCAARKQFLGTTLQKNFSVINSIAPTSGFFTYGEIYHNKLLNITTTLLFLSEGDSDKKRIPHFHKQVSKTDDALFHLIEYSIKKIELQESELQRSQSSLNELTQAIDETLIISKTDPKGKITYVNKNFEVISGYSAKELLGKAHNIVRDPNVPSEVFQDLWQTIQAGKIWHGDFSNRRKDGTIYYIKSSIIPIHNEKNETIEYLAIREDISEIVESQHRVEKQMRFSKLILDNSDSIIFILKNGIISDVNQQFYNTFEYDSLESFLSWHSCVCELFIEKEGYIKPSHDNATWYKPILQNKHQTHLALIMNKYSQERIYNVKAKEIHDEQDIITIISLTDITEFEIAKQKAQEAERSQAMFLANMSHEIRTPMNGISGFIELLCETQLDEKQHKYLHIIRSSAQTLLEIINDILDFSKFQSEGIVLEMLPAKLKDEVKNVYTLLSSYSAKKDITFKYDIDENISDCLLVDITKLKQVLTNLISNAIKFTPESGQVTLSMHLKKDNAQYQIIQFSVKDSGIGIAKDKQEKIFQPFSQADDSTTRKFGGTGLGLSITSSIINAYNSELKLHSSEGVGSDFYFNLQLTKCEENPTTINQSFQTRQSSVELLSDKEFNVLVAEDYDINRMLISSVFDTFPNLHLTFAEDGLKAVNKAKKEQFDIIFMDINMPNMNGMQAAQNIRKLPNYKNIPIIALTANVVETDREKFLQSGMDNYLAKPLVLDEFYKILHQYLNMTQKHQENQNSQLAEDKEEKSVSTLNITQIIQNVTAALGFEKDVVLKFLRAYSSSLADVIISFEKAIAEKNRSEIKDLAHKLKGSSSTLHIDNITTMMQEIEENIDKETFNLKQINVQYLHTMQKTLERELRDASKS